MKAAAAGYWQQVAGVYSTGKKSYVQDYSKYAPAKFQLF